MFNKNRGLLILLIFVVGIFAISCASAADNATDTIATDDTDCGEDILKTTDESEVSTCENDDEVLKDSSDDVLSGVLVYSHQYSVQIQDNNEISSTAGGNFYYYLKPYNMLYTDNYNFRFDMYDHSGKVYETGYIQSDAGTTAEGYKFIQLGKNILKPGTYRVYAINRADGNTMSANTLKVSGIALITANDFNGVYNTGKMTARATDSKGNPLTSMSIRVDFTRAGTTVTRYYDTDANGYVSFTPPVGAGTWCVKFSSGLSHVTASAVVKTAKITKAQVSIRPIG